MARLLFPSTGQSGNSRRRQQGGQMQALIRRTRVGLRLHLLQFEIRLETPQSAQHAVAYMLAHRVSGSRRIGGHQHFHEILMGFRTAFSGTHRAKPGGSEGAGAADRIGKGRASRTFRNTPVKLFVQAQVNISISIGLLTKRVHARRQFGQFGALIAGRVFREEHGGLRFQGFTDHIMAFDVGAGGNPHSGTRTRTTFQQTLVFQAEQCLRNRQKTHSEFGGHFATRDHLAHGKFSAEDALAYNLIRLTGQSEVFGGLSVAHNRSSLYVC